MEGAGYPPPHPPIPLGRGFSRLWRSFGLSEGIDFCILQEPLLDVGAEAQETPYNGWSRTGLKQFALLVPRGRIPQDGDLAALWIAERRTWCLEMATLQQKIASTGKGNPWKRYRRLMGAVGRRVEALQLRWQALAGLHPQPPSLYGCTTFVLEISPYAKRPDMDKMPALVRGHAPGSNIVWEGPFSPATQAEQKAWSLSQKIMMIRQQEEGPPPYFSAV